MPAHEVIEELLRKLPLAGGGLAFIAVMRHLRPRSLAHAPKRDGLLVVTDLLAGFCLFVLGMVAIAGLLRQLGLPDREQWSIEQTAAVNLLYAAVGQGPVVLLLFWRAATTDGGWLKSGLLTTAPLRDLRLGVVALLAALPMVLTVGTIVIELTARLGQPVPPSGHEMLSAMSEAESAVTLTMLLCSAILIAPVMEETIYRGIVQTALLEVFGREQRWCIVLLSAFGFAFVHAGSVPSQMLLALYILGIVLGWLYEHTGSLWPCIIVHMGFNAANSGLWLLLNRTAEQQSSRAADLPSVAHQCHDLLYWCSSALPF